MSTSKSRIKTDVMKLLMSDYNVNLVKDNLQEFNVKFRGPEGTPYEGGTWKIHVELPNEYPYRSPSIGFLNKIYHPNIDEGSGSVCLDVINQTWSPMFDIFNIFEIFLPQLLSYPNAADPLNSEASQMYMNNVDEYHKKVKEYVKRYAADSAFEDEEEDSQEEADDLSSAESVESEEEEEDDDDDDDEEDYEDDEDLESDEEE